MNDERNHTRHYWIRHKNGYLFCGICKKIQDKIKDSSVEKENSKL